MLKSDKVWCRSGILYSHKKVALDIKFNPNYIKKVSIIYAGRNLDVVNLHIVIG